MNWVRGKIAPCASCERIKPLRVVGGEPICAECAHELASSPTGAVATDGGERQ